MGNASSNSALTVFGPDDFGARSPDELSLRKGDRVELIERDDDFGDGWYLGKQILSGNTGLFPEGESFVNSEGVEALTLSDSLHINHSKDHPSLRRYHGHS